MLCHLALAFGSLFIAIVPPSDAFSSTLRTPENHRYGQRLLRHNGSLRRCGISASSNIIGDIVHPPNVAEWFHDYLDLSVHEQKKLYSRWPSGAKCIERLGKDRLHEWLAFFESDAVGMDRNRLRRMIVSRPQLLSYSLSNVRSTTSFFREELGLTSKEYASLLRSYPSALMHSVDRRLRPTVAFLQDECGGGRDNWRSWRRVVWAYPRVFSHSLDGTLRPKVRFLSGGGAGLRLMRSELSQVVGMFPPTLWLGEEILRSKLKFLRESLGLEPSELRAVVVSYPQVLGLSLENNLRRKVDFFLGGVGANGEIGCGLNRDQLKEFVLYQPALLAYSLEKRLRPRIARMQEMNIFFYYCPKNIMSYTDEKFDGWMSTQVATWSISE